MWQRYAFGAVLALFAILSGWMISVTPYREAGRLVYQRAVVQDVGAPDERQHANYVRHLMDGKGFPVLKPGDPNLYESYQSHQPPLYYLIGVGFCKVFAIDPTDPERGIKLRYLNTLTGLATLAGIYYAIRWGLGRTDVALAGMALIGLMPMFISLNSAVTNDSLAYCLITWTFAMACLGASGGLTWKRTVLMGALAGLALVTKTTAVVTLPLIVATPFLVRHIDPRWMAKAAAAVGIALVIVAPWWIRNTQIYGDPLAIRAFKEAFVGTAYREQFIENIAAMRQAKGLDPGGATMEYWSQWFGWWTLRSFFGAFSQMDIFLPNPVYGVLSLLSAVVVLGWSRGIRPSDEPEERARAGRFHVLAAVLLVGVFLSYLQFNWTYFQAQARYLYPAVAPIAAGFGLGLCTLVRKPAVSFALALIFAIALNGYVLSVLPAEFGMRMAAARTAP